ncbi:MAG: glycosyl transferase family protein [Acetobacteraceae bacterium]|nr:glycosyl transferase family protein [Acetobacteraceae bacterium]
MTRTAASEAAFARFVAILGRGPGRSRALTREEAQEAFGLVLTGQADPHQVGAFLMLLRFRGEDPDEITGMVEATRRIAELGNAGLDVALDWPSYGAGRTRGAPWFLLAALALARAGISVLMHGSNEFSGGIPVPAGLRAVGLAPSTTMAEVATALRTARFAYFPLARMAPAIDQLLGLRRLFGLRSPVNTAARLLNPGDAPAGVDGVFHPPYIAVHLGVAERMGRPRLLVLKGGGGEAERVPLKPVTAHLWDAATGRSEVALPAVPDLEAPTPQADTPDLLAAVWRGDAAPPAAVATVQATIALGLLALGRAATGEQADEAARAVWAARL